MNPNFAKLENVTDFYHQTILKGDNFGQLQHPVDLVLTVLAASGPLLQLPTAQASLRNIPNPSQREVVTVQNGRPVQGD